VHSSFNCLYLFENQERFILEIKRTDLPAEAVQSDTCKWLLVDKDGTTITELVLLALNSGDFNEERFFRQGYLSFDSDQAIYIRESSSLQNVLKTAENNELSQPLTVAIQHWLAEMGLCRETDSSL
jgi:hypothetical protein